MLAKTNRLTKRGSFDYLYRKGEARANQALVLVFMRSRNNVRAGFSVGNKLGKATKRNKIKRRLRSSFRQFVDRVQPCQIVFVAKPPIRELTYDQICNLMHSLLEKARLLEN